MDETMHKEEKFKIIALGSKKSPSHLTMSV